MSIADFCLTVHTFYVLQPAEFENYRGIEGEAAAGMPANWGKLTSEPIAVHEVPGDHYTMFLEPHVRTLAERLGRCLDAVDSIAGVRGQGSGARSDSA